MDVTGKSTDLPKRELQGMSDSATVRASPAEQNFLHTSLRNPNVFSSISRDCKGTANGVNAIGQQEGDDFEVQGLP